MAQKLSLEELKNRLLELIEDSEALKTIPEQEKKDRTALMMAGSAEEIAGYIQVFEAEEKTINNINEELNEHAEEIQEAVVTQKYDKIKLQRQEEVQKEEKLRVDDEKEAENLIKKLEEVVQKKEKSVEKKKSKSFKFTPKATLREGFASLIGAILCGLAGILIIFLMILPMGTYERLDIAFSLKPAIFFPAYWVAVIFSAFLGLIIISILRLIKTKSILLSALVGGIVGGVVVGLTHMAFGLKYDIIILQDINPIGIRGYWISVIFAVLIGFFAQFINRLINRIGFFKIADK